MDRALAEAGEQAGAVDVLVNNAGVGDQALADQADWARVRNVLHANVLAVAQLTTALVPSMAERRRGGVLNLGSGAGLTVMPAAAAHGSAAQHERSPCAAVEKALQWVGALQERSFVGSSAQRRHHLSGPV